MEFASRPLPVYPAGESVCHLLSRELVSRPLPVYPAGESVHQITTPPPTPRAGGSGAAVGYLLNFPSGGTSPPGG